LSTISEIRDFANTNSFKLNLKAFLSMFAVDDAFSDFTTPDN